MLAINNTSLSRKQIQRLVVPVDAGDAGDILLAADALGEQPVPDLPGEHGWVLLLVLGDRVHHHRRGHLRLRPPDHPSLEVTSLVESGGNKYFRISVRQDFKLFVSEKTRERRRNRIKTWVMQRRALMSPRRAKAEKRK